MISLLSSSDFQMQAVPLIRCYYWEDLEETKRNWFVDLRVLVGVQTNTSFNWVLPHTGTLVWRPVQVWCGPAFSVQSEGELRFVLLAGVLSMIAQQTNGYSNTYWSDGIKVFISQRSCSWRKTSLLWADVIFKLKALIKIHQGSWQTCDLKTGVVTL